MIENWLVILFLVPLGIMVWAAAICGIVALIAIAKEMIEEMRG